MAERRMFSKTIIDSDAFLDMPLSSQALYFHLSMRADDEGLINNPKKIARMIGASDDDMKVLITKRFIIPFDSGIVVIKHWRIHNLIRGDRKKDSVYESERAMLTVKGNGAYQLTTDCQPNDNQVTTKCPHRLGKVSIGKDSIGEGSIVEGSAIDNHCHTENEDETVENAGDQMTVLGGDLGRGVVLLTGEQTGKLLDTLGFDMFNVYVKRLADFIIDKNASVHNHYQTILKWYKEDSKG